MRKKSKSKKAQAALERDIEFYVRLWVKSTMNRITKQVDSVFFREFDDDVMIDENLLRNAIERSIVTLFGEVRHEQSNLIRRWFFHFFFKARPSVDWTRTRFVSIWNRNDPNQSEVNRPDSLELNSYSIVFRSQNVQSNSLCLSVVRNSWKTILCFSNRDERWRKRWINFVDDDRWLE